MQPLPRGPLYFPLNFPPPRLWRLPPFLFLVCLPFPPLLFFPCFFPLSLLLVSAFLLMFSNFLFPFLIFFSLSLSLPRKPISPGTESKRRTLLGGGIGRGEPFCQARSLVDCSLEMRFLGKNDDLLPATGLPLKQKSETNP